MQCPTCFSHFPDKIANCPRCRRPLVAQAAVPEAAPPPPEPQPVAPPPRRAVVTQTATAVNREARVLAFPERATANNRPQWRQEVSARLREYQTRRSHILDGTAEPELEPSGPQPETRNTAAPGVVSLTQRKELEPLVVRALQRLERARQTMPQPEPVKVVEPDIAPALPEAPPEPEPVSGLEYGLKLPVTIKAPPPEPARANRVVLEQSVPLPTQEAAESRAEERPAAKLVAVPPVETAPAVPAEPSAKPKPRLVHAAVVDDEYLEQAENEKKKNPRNRKKWLPALEETEDDFAPWQLRLRAAAIDAGVAVATALPLLLWAGLSASNWHWGDLFLLFLLHVVLFTGLYATALTFYAGRTWGQELLFLYVANVEDGGPPSLRQCALRAGIYLLWPLTLGLGLLYALVDPEGQALHDKVSGTIVLRS